MTREVLVTDTVAPPAHDWPQLRVVSVAPLIASALRRFLSDGPLRVAEVGKQNGKGARREESGEDPPPRQGENLSPPPLSNVETRRHKNLCPRAPFSPLSLSLSPISFYFGYGWSSNGRFNIIFLSSRP